MVWVGIILVVNALTIFYKCYSKSKLNSLKKDEIIEYLITLNYEKQNLKKKKKNLLIEDLIKETEKLKN